MSLSFFERNLSSQANRPLKSDDFKIIRRGHEGASTGIRVQIFSLTSISGYRYNIDTIEQPKKVFLVSVIHSAKPANFVHMAFNLVNTVARTRDPWTGNGGI